MSWYAEESKFDREIIDRDGKVWKLTLRPASEGDIIAIDDTEGLSDSDLYARQIIAWDHPDPPTVENLKRLDIFLTRQIQTLVNEINSAEPGKRKQAAAADPTKPPSGSSDESSVKRPELVAS